MPVHFFWNPKYSINILIIFVLLEVFLYGPHTDLQYMTSILEYVFIFYTFIANKKIGIMYFISFTLLSMSTWSYVIGELRPSNFWGLDVLFGVSLNAIISVIILIYLIISSNLRINVYWANTEIKFLSFIIASSFIIGIISVIFNIIHFDRFVVDMLTYGSFIVYIYLFSFLDLQSCEKIIINSFTATAIGMIVSLLFDIRFQYALTQNFIPMNSISFIFPISVFFLRSLFNRTQFILLVGTTFIVLLSGEYFIGVKLIIMFFILFVWCIFSKYKSISALSIAIILFIIFYDPIYHTITNYFSDTIISDKISQAFSILEVSDYHYLISQKTSAGNILAEAITLLSNITQNPLKYILGVGMGGGISDFNYLLSKFAGQGGYAFIDSYQNYFHRMHLPIFEITIKAGLLGAILYLFIIIKSFFNRNIYSFTYCILLLTVFSVSKEMILLTLLFIYTAYLKEKRMDAQVLNSPMICADTLKTRERINVKEHE